MNNDKLVLDALWDTSNLSPKQLARVESVLAEWPPLETETALQFEYRLACREMSRDSKQKKLAYQHGLIRPFLLLASMHPKRRALCAKTLELDLLSKPFFGDSHAEAWYMIEKDRKGIQARSNLAFQESLNPFARSCNWYETVERVTRRAFGKNKSLDKMIRKEIKGARKNYKETTGPCQDPLDLTTPHLEELFMRALSRVMWDSFTEQQQEEIERIMKSDDARELAHRMSQTGWTDNRLITFLVALAILDSEKSQRTEGSQQFTEKRETGAFYNFNIGLNTVMLFVTPVLVFPAVMLVHSILGAVWQSTPGWLIPLMIDILSQRSWLSLAGISIEDYYPSLS